MWKWGRWWSSEGCPILPLRVHHLVQFFLQHHPCVKLNLRHEWVDGKFVMVDIDKDNVSEERCVSMCRGGV